MVDRDLNDRLAWSDLDRSEAIARRSVRGLRTFYIKPSSRVRPLSTKFEAEPLSSEAYGARQPSEIKSI